ncbi:ABC transporter ATP-binding protein [Cardiobacteriaceae bacterium TAE3-ERU3]|nr:ABC transporter ATP-binding protein [Cardiobacteriaceae bacterium TAE3-ERU3]
MSDSAAQEQPRLAVHDLVVGYGDKVIIDGVNLTVANGGITALVGPNGCGKSTLVKAMARVLKPTAGTVMLDGEDVHKANSKLIAKKMALLPQGPIAPEGLTVRELVAQGRFPHQSLVRQWSKADHEAIEQAMLDADITQFADRPVSAMSGGQRQRVWIAMILAQQTDFLLLDEPTTFLDMKVQIDVLSLLARATRDVGRTLVIVLHELNMAAAFADHMVMMRDGQIITSGAPREVFTEENLAKVFDLDAAVMTDPTHGHPVCLPRLYAAGNAS